MAALLPLFPETDRLKEGVAASNAAKTDKLGLVLSKVIAACGSAATWPFTSEEEQQLSGILGLDARGTACLLEFAAYIFETSAYHNLKTATLGQHLLGMGMCETSAVAIGQAWSSDSAALVGRMRARQLGAPSVLLGTSWRLNLEVGSTAASSTKTAEAVIDFRIGGANNAAPGSQAQGQGQGAISVAFSQQSLLSFLERLDVIQAQMDSLS